MLNRILMPLAAITFSCSTACLGPPFKAQHLPADVGTRPRSSDYLRSLIGQWYPYLLASLSSRLDVIRQLPWQGTNLRYAPGQAVP